MVSNDPFHQFVVQFMGPHLTLGGYDVTFNNSALFMIVAVVLSSALVIGGTMAARLVPNRIQSVVEVLYGAISTMVRDMSGPHSKPLVPFVFSLFLFVLFGNLLGMVPLTFTFTSHIIVTFAMAAMVMTVVTVIGFVRHGLHFFSLFLPSGVPLVLAPLMIVIEVVSYLARVMSLSVRLAANMLAGHMMLKIFAGFTGLLGASLGVMGWGIGILPIFLNIALTGFEIFVAVLQAYIFALLTCVYLRDALELH